jgi:anti-sigma B factor antagonist
MGHFNVLQVGGNTIVEFTCASLMDPLELEQVAQQIYQLIEEPGHHRMVVDFEKVQYLSSQAIGMIMAMQKKLSAFPDSRLVLCAVGPRLAELLRITKLEKVLKVVPTQQEAMKIP